jgi:hypothetical protein
MENGRRYWISLLTTSHVVEEADRVVYKGKESVRRYFVDLLGGGPDKPERPG